MADNAGGATLKDQLVDFFNFINEPPPYEDQRMVRDYRHELARKWMPLHEKISAAIPESAQARIAELEAALDAAQKAICSKPLAKGDEHEHDLWLRNKIRAALSPREHNPPRDQTAWDAPSNRSYEPVEILAAEIYAGFSYEGTGKKPDWVPGGNSLKQDLARMDARKMLRGLGHSDV